MNYFKKQNIILFIIASIVFSFLSKNIIYGILCAIGINLFSYLLEYFYRTYITPEIIQEMDKKIDEIKAELQEIKELIKQK